MSPHYDRGRDADILGVDKVRPDDVHDDVAEVAAEALREAEVEAVQPAETIPSAGAKLEEMSIDDLRKLAAKLDVPDRSHILERDKLIAAIEPYL
jgi:hypothetical protein